MPCYPYNRGGNYGDYYRGDYYRGDYYRGDPGFFSGLLGIAKKVGGAVLKATPVGRAVAAAATIGTAVGILPRRGRSEGFDPTMLAPPPPPGMAVGPPLPMGVGPYGNLQGCLIGNRAGRWNKSTYITRGGGTSRWPQQLIVHEKGTECVRPRRMNVANPRALRRALRRASGFAKLARRYVAVTRRFKKGGRKKKR